MAGGPGPDDGSPRNDAGQQVDPGQYQGGDSIVTKDGTEYQNQGGQWVKTGKNFGPYDPNSGSKGDGLKDSEPKAGDPGDGVAGGGMPEGGALTGFIGDRGDRAGAHAESSFGLMAGQQSVSQASTSGDRATRDAKNTLDSAGNEAQSTGAKAAGATAAGDRENGWGKAIADGIQQGVEKGLTQAGDSFGQGAADKASSAIFKGGGKLGGADTSGGAAAGGAATAAGGTPVGAAGGVQVASTGSKSGGGHGTKSGGGSKTSPGSKGNKGSSGGGSSSGVSSGTGATGGGSFTGMGHCPKCGRTDLVESVYDHEGMTVHDWRCPSCNVTGHSGPPPPGLGGSSPASPAPAPPLPVVSSPSPAPPPPVEKKQRCPICKSPNIKYTNTHYLYGDVYHCGGCGAAFKGRDIVVE
jgi:ribosomal protein L37AE/L43A